MRARAGVFDDIDRGLDEAEPAPPGSSASGWGEPDPAVVARHRGPAPALPLEPFGPTWAAWIAGAAEAKGAPPDFVALPLLAGAAALLATKRRAAPWPGWAEPPVLWGACVGLPSSGKSPGIDAVADPLRALEAELNADLDERTRQHRTDKLEAEVRREAWEKEAREAVKGGLAPPVMPAAAREPEPPMPRRVVLTDATPERLVRLSGANERGLLLLRDELAGWMGNMDRYGGSGGDRALWLEAYGARPYQLDRVKDSDKPPVSTPALAVCITGGIQPDRLASVVLAGDDDGLAARFLYAWPEPRRPRRPTRFPDPGAALARLRRAAALGDRADPLPLAAEAAGQLQTWREDVAAMEAGAHGLFLSWLGKLPGAAVRLALVLEFLRWCGDGEGSGAPEPGEVGEAATAGALALLEAYFLPMARRVFGDAAWPEAERDAAGLGRWLLAARPPPAVVNARGLRHAAALPTRDPARYDRALAELADAGWVREAPGREGGTAGRRRKDWEVNPAVAGLAAAREGAAA